MRNLKLKLVWSLVILALLLLGARFMLVGGENAPSGEEQASAPVEQIPPSSGNTDIIRVDSPLPREYVSSPIHVSGQARGNWFFEASFPLILVDWDGKIIAQGHADAKSDWMTTDYVPFKAELSFTQPDYGSSSDQEPFNRGALILRKDNPSGLSQYDDAVEIPVYFK